MLALGKVGRWLIRGIVILPRNDHYKLMNVMWVQNLYTMDKKLEKVAISSLLTMHVAAALMDLISKFEGGGLFAKQTTCKGISAKSWRRAYAGEGGAYQQDTVVHAYHHAGVNRSLREYGTVLSLGCVSHEEPCIRKFSTLDIMLLYCSLCC